MGIRHLITFLRPYATTLESLGGHKVVIDGPSFAHQIYYICLQASPGAKNALEAAPSYRELVNVAIAWLDGLRGSNVEIMKIYFDGFLPPGKLDVRLKRLRENTNRLSNFHVAYKEPCKNFSPDNAISQCLELFRNRSVPSGLTTLPALPFVVPAILEALNASSTYGGFTETVPGEADLYCAKHLKKYGGIVLTSDSDLLVHDLGSKGAVSFFSDIAPVGNDEPDQLRTQLFSPADMSIRLGLPKSHGLTSLAFEIHIDSHGSFQNLLGKARSLKAVTGQPQTFQDFLKEYTEVPDEPIISAEHAGTVQALRSLDPRTSEYVLQFNSLALISGQPPVSRQATSVSPHVFLPFLLDCPVRTTAWEVSSAIRQLAYGLVNLIVPDDEQVSWVFEHRKQIDQSKGRGLTVASLSEVPGACLSLIERFERLRLKLLNLKESEVWIAVALQQDIDSSHSNSKTPSIQLFIQAWGKLECSDEKGGFSWDVVHFFAQLQATLFSLRMLKQISDIVIATRSTKVPDSLLKLNQLLDSLPALIEYPNNRSAASISRKSESATFLALIRRVLTALDYDCQPRVSLPAAKENKASKKKRKREAAATDTPVSKIWSNNPFDVLGDDCRSRTSTPATKLRTLYHQPEGLSPKTSPMVTTRSASKGDEGDPVLIGSSPPPISSKEARKARRKERKLARKAATSVRIDPASGRIQKLSAPRIAAAPSNAGQPGQPATAPPNQISQNPNNSNSNRNRSRIFNPRAAPENPDIPFHIQHSLFKTVQKLAEHALFDWAHQWVNTVLLELRWEVPEQGELNTVRNPLTNIASHHMWVNALSPHINAVQRALYENRAQIDWNHLEMAIRNLHQLRHAAVHRLPVILAITKTWIAYALKLCDYLNDSSRSEKMRAIQMSLDPLDLVRLQEVIAEPVTGRPLPPVEADPAVERELPAKKGHFFDLTELSDDEEPTSKETRYIDLTELSDGIEDLDGEDEGEEDVTFSYQQSL